MLMDSCQQGGGVSPAALKTIDYCSPCDNGVIDQTIINNQLHCDPVCTNGEVLFQLCSEDVEGSCDSRCQVRLRFLPSDT